MNPNIYIRRFNKAVLANKDLHNVVDFIDNYRSTISTDVVDTGKYSFKAFLIQVANHPSANATPIQFIRYDLLDEKEKSTVNRIATLVKYKYKEVPMPNLDLLRPGKVVAKIQEALGNPKVIRSGVEGDRFTMDAHTRCWKKYEVRPSGGSENPQNTKKEYCIYDEPHDDYLYTSDWVLFLAEKLKSEAEFTSLYS